MVLPSIRLEADDATSVCLHDEGAAMGLAILEFMGHLRLEVVDVVEFLRLEVPDIEDAGLLLCADANGDEHLVFDDASALPNMV